MIELKDINPTAQMPLFPSSNPIIDELRELDLNNINPIDALNKLFEWQKKVKQ
jgi:DNA mismatch repair protein MutS